MEISKDLYPIEASVLSSSAIEKTIKTEYFSERNNISCRIYYRSINDTYIVYYNNQKYYFKVYRYGYRTISEIQAEIDLINHLRNHGILTTEPVMKKDGDYIVQFKGAEGKRYAVLYTTAGIKSSDKIEETGLYNEKLGLYVSSIHKAWDKIDYPVDRWHLDLNSFIDNPMSHIRNYTQWYSFDINFLEEVARKTKERINNTFQRNTPGYGICHGDIYTGNLRFNSNGDPVLFDYDFCGYGWRTYDISVYLNAFSLGLDNVGIEKKKRRREAFLKGYKINMSLSTAELDNMYLFVPFRRIFNLGTIYISMSNTWGDNWVNMNLNEDIEMLKKWIDYAKF